MRADKNFKFSKSAKRVLATITDKSAREAYKKAMIDAELSFEAGKKKPIRDAKDKAE